MFVPPKRLHMGSRVAIVAPASPFEPDEVAAGLAIVRECGLVPVLGHNLRLLQAEDVHAAPIVDRANELMWAFTDPNIEAVITILGGLGSGETLPYLDYGAIRQSRRALLGLSDITALNNGILAGSGLISINGQYPSIRVREGKALRDADSDSLRLTLELMMSDQPWGEQPFRDNPYLSRTVAPGRAEGYVVGGNLDTFCTLLGTPFCPPLENAILFIEDVHKDGELLARMFIHLRLAGVFDKVAGIVIGEFAETPQETGEKVPSIESVISHQMKNGPPCTYGYNFSHGPWTAPIPIGAWCKMDADTGEVSFDFSMSRN